MVRAKKNIGQHFLHDENVAQKIIDAFAPSKGAFVIEIGFGTGVLTKYLLQKYSRALFLDVDRESYDYMVKQYPAYKEKFLLKDFLLLDLKALDGKVSIVGNLPYHISSQIFFKLFEYREVVEEGVFMVQKEVANRLVSTGGSKDFGILSVLLGLFFEVDKLFDVSRGAFVPPPKVTSSVIKLKSKGEVYLGVSDEILKLTVKTIFGKRRKMIRNSLLSIGIDPGRDISLKPYLDKRPEQLTIEDFVVVAKAVQKQKLQ